MTKNKGNPVLFHRREIADSIIDTISQSIDGSKVSLRGSVFTGKDDDLSDIDILVEHKELTDLELAHSVINSLKSSYSVIFEDWAKSFLPKECVITFFVDDLPLHCFIEVAIIVPKTSRTLTSDVIVNKSPDHELKLWIIAGKKLSRGQDNGELAYLARSLFAKNVEQIGEPIEALKIIFKSISTDTKRQYPTLYTKCIQYLQRVEQKYSTERPRAGT